MAYHSCDLPTQQVEQQRPVTILGCDVTEIKAGIRVARGPDWCYGDQDIGEEAAAEMDKDKDDVPDWILPPLRTGGRGLGTVVGPSSRGHWCVVRWEREGAYRALI